MNDRIRVPRTSRRAWITGTLTALAVPILLGGRATAGLTIEFHPANVSAAAGSAGNIFDVLLVSDNSTPAGTNLSSFSVTFSAPAASGIDFTSANTTTGQPYVFAGDNSGGFTFTPGPSSGIISDSALDLNAPIAASTTYGLGEVFFSVAPDARLATSFVGITGSLTGGPPNFDNVPFTRMNGLITVTPAAVPEPSTAVMTALGLAGVLASASWWGAEAEGN